MELLTNEIRQALLANGLRLEDEPDLDPIPLVKLFTPDAGCTWLIAWAQEEGDDLILWGLCDLGLGYPELGPVLYSELLSVRGHRGLPVERDLSFQTQRLISSLACEAMRLGAIRA